MMTVSNARPEATSALVNTYATYPFTLARAAGEYVFDTADTRYLDLYGGHCVCATGHSHPHVVAAMKQQLDRLFFYSNAAPIEIREQAATKLIDFAGAEMVSTFFCNSGSEANENALKAAVLQTGRKRFLAFEGSFHGRTLLALSMSDSEKLKSPYQPLLAEVCFAPFNDLPALEQVDLSEVAAVILEPVQSMTGVRVADGAWLKLLRKKCTAEGALLIFDEVQTGFARLGTPFAANYFGVFPDMITLAKGIASGFPMGAVLFREGVSKQINPGDFGSTFGGGPVACAALLATLEVIEQEGLTEHVRQCGDQLASKLPGEVIKEVRGIGLLLGLDVGIHATALKQFLLQHGILVGGSNDPSVLRLMPPLILTVDAISILVEAVQQFEAQTTGATK